MDICKDILKKAGVLPKLRLGTQIPGGGVKSTGAHTVIILDEKKVTDIDPDTGKDAEYLRLLVSEDGEHKTYQTKVYNDDGTPTYMIERFAQIEKGTRVIMEMRRAGKRNYISIVEVDSPEVDGAPEQPMEV